MQGGDKFDGCLYTDNKGNGSWPYLEQGLLKLPDPSNFKVWSQSLVSLPTWKVVVSQ
jgi:hypothetical protein